jgi:enoyl-CoA hydratase/carnithine racemase
VSEGRTHLAVEGAIARITFDRPAARNAMTWRMYEELAAACEAIAGRTDVRVAVFRGAGGRAFVAGTDIEQFRSFKSGEDGVAYEAKVNAYVEAVEKLPVPTIAVVEGWAVGGGLAIANACNLRIASPGARFGVPIAATLGNCLSAANMRRLTATLGDSRVQRMLLLAEMPTAEDLAPTGYVAAIVEPAALDAHIQAMCGKLAGHAPLTMKAAKEALRRLAVDAQADDGDLIRAVYGSADFREGVDAFVAKRPPLWRGT